MSIPLTDSSLVPFSNNWNTRLNADYADFHITQQQAIAYTAVHAPYIAAVTTMNVSRAEGTRSMSQTTERDATKSALLAYARQLYATIAANVNVSDANKASMGIHIRSGSRSRIAAPVAKPSMQVISVVQRTIVVRVSDVDSMSKRGKPRGSTHAFVYAFVGTDYPSDDTRWQFIGAASRDEYEFTFPEYVPSGATVWVCARWVNRKGQTGALGIPVSTNIQGGGSSSAGRAMKVAA